jgi:hypothetical protein
MTTSPSILRWMANSRLAVTKPSDETQAKVVRLTQVARCGPFAAHVHVKGHTRPTRDVIRSDHHRPRAFPQASVTESSVALPPGNGSQYAKSPAHQFIPSHRPSGLPKVRHPDDACSHRHEAPGEDRRTFECPMCEHSESILVVKNPLGTTVGALPR